jgi:hypothetical protein
MEIISLGASCHTKELIVNYQTNKQSMPFDSVNSYCIDNVYNVIEDLLNDRICYEKYVDFNERHENCYGLWFGHFDPPPQKQAESNLIVFKRRLGRFKDAFLSDHSKLFVFYNRQSKKDYPENKMLSKINSILEKANGNNKILIINHIKDTMTETETDHLKIVNLDVSIDKDTFNSLKPKQYFKEYLMSNFKKHGVLEFLASHQA